MTQTMLVHRSCSLRLRAAAVVLSTLFSCGLGCASHRLVTQSQCIVLKRVVEFESPGAVHIADLDHDGRSDIIIMPAGISPGPMAVLWADADGEWSPPDYLSGVSGPSQLAIADMDSDGLLDLCICTGVNGQGRISIFRNIGERSFAIAATFQCPATPKSIVVSDFDSSGDLDILVSCPAAAALLLYWNKGGWVFRPDGRSVSELPYWVSMIAAGDVDDDKRPDVILVSTSGDLWVLRNTTSEGFDQWKMKADETLQELSRVLPDAILRDLWRALDGPALDGALLRFWPDARDLVEPTHMKPVIVGEYSHDAAGEGRVLAAVSLSGVRHSEFHWLFSGGTSDCQQTMILPLYGIVSDFRVYPGGGPETGCVAVSILGLDSDYVVIGAWGDAGGGSK